MNYTDEEQITLEYVFTNEKGEKLKSLDHFIKRLGERFDL